MTTQQLLEERLWPGPGGLFSGFQFAIGAQGKLAEAGFGGILAAKRESAPVQPTTVFDIASLTKLFTATLAVVLHERGTLDLAAPISTWAQVPRALGGLSSEELLTHSSGLPPIWQEGVGKEETAANLYSLSPNLAQRGNLVYSCTGYSLFALALESLMSTSFEELILQNLIQPLGLERTCYNPTGLNIAFSSEPDDSNSPNRVNDPRARQLGGVSGNAGLFSNSEDLFRFFSELTLGHNGIVCEAARARLFTPLVVGEWQQCIGLRFRDVERLGTRDYLHSHTGYTGSLVLIDRDAAEVSVLLTNRLQCSTSKEQITDLYRAFAAKATRSANG